MDVITFLETNIKAIRTGQEALLEESKVANTTLDIISESLKSIATDFHHVAADVHVMATGLGTVVNNSNAVTSDVHEITSHVHEIAADAHESLTNLNNFIVFITKLFTPKIVGIDVQPGDPTTHPVP